MLTFSASRRAGRHLFFFWFGLRRTNVIKRVRVAVDHADFVFKCMFEKSVKGVHLQLVQLKDAETLLKRLVDDMAELLHFYTN